MTKYLQKISTALKATLLIAFISMTSLHPAIDVNGDLMIISHAGSESSLALNHIEKSQDPAILNPLTESTSQIVSLSAATTYVFRWFINFTKLFFRHLALLFTETVTLKNSSEWSIQILLFGCSYYFFRLSVLSSQAHPPTI